MPTLTSPCIGATQPFEAEVKLAASGATAVFQGSGCSQDCIEQQLKEGHKGMGDREGDVKHSPSGSTMSNEEITSKSAAYKPEVIAE